MLIIVSDVKSNSLKLAQIDFKKISIYLFQENCNDFEETKWYNCLVFLGSNDDEAISTDDDDVKILPAIVDKILIPKLTSREDFYSILSLRR